MVKSNNNSHFADKMRAAVTIRPGTTRLLPVLRIISFNLNDLSVASGGRTTRIDNPLAAFIHLQVPSDR
jgi:hypothetical protein